MYVSVLGHLPAMHVSIWMIALHLLLS